MLLLLLSCQGPPLVPADADGDGADVSEDCDDADPSVHPDAPDTDCDGVDDDCDGSVDEENGSLRLWYRDADGDGYGTSEDFLGACSQPDGYVDDFRDCDDGDARIAPGARDDVCDAVDDDCDGRVDEDAIPGGVEVCDDGLDNDCDGLVEEQCGFVEVDASRVPWRLEAESAGADMGSSIAMDADADGDGRVDVLVGARDAADVGAAYLYTSLPDGVVATSQATARFSSTSTESTFGDTVAFVPDLDGDGAVELALSAPYRREGRGLVFLTSGTGAGSIDLGESGAWIGDDDDAHAGVGLAGLADVDGEGTPGLLIGAKGQADGDGAAYVVGEIPTGTDSLADAVRLSGPATGDRAGTAVASVGDVDGDGAADVLVGGQGTAWLVHGPLLANVDLGDADATLRGEEEGDGAGATLARAGDIDGDGLDDLLIGAPWSEVGGADAGAAYLVTGSPRGDIDLAQAHSRLLGEGCHGGAGMSVTALGDIDGDGRNELGIGAGWCGANVSIEGAFYVLFDAPAGTSDIGEVASARVLGGVESGFLGTRAAGGHDVDGDGLGDLLIRAAGEYDWEAGTTGVVHVLTPATWF